MPYAEVEDELVYGYFVAPADMFEPLPAVIMIHEWWGLNDNVRAQADRLAAAGYIVFAVDLFGGKTATTPSAARELMLTVVEDPESADENLLSTLLGLVGEHEKFQYFKFCYASGPEAAFRKHLRNYRDFGGSKTLLNTAEPTR